MDRTMHCKELEALLEAYLDGELDEVAARRCARHLEACARCSELIAPLAEPAALDEDLAAAVLERTGAAACGAARRLLCAHLDGELGGEDGELVDGHLAHCPDCAGLAAVLLALGVDLPRLAELSPGPGFVDAVLAATLPPGVRLRRWWHGVWPRWVARPRFATESAFVATLLVVLLVAIPGAPLAAMPARALELARTQPGRIELPAAAIEKRIEVLEGAARERGERARRVAVGSLSSWARPIFDGLATSWGTLRDGFASLLQRGDAEAEPARPQTDNHPPYEDTP